MKILFAQASMDTSVPTVYLAGLVQAELAKKGHAVHVLGKAGEGAEHRAEEKITRHCYRDPKGLKTEVKYERLNHSSLPLAGRALSLAACPPALWASLRRRLTGGERDADVLAGQIDLLNRAIGFDAVISVSAPYYTAQAAAQCGSRAKKVAYVMDPFATNRLFKPPRGVHTELRVAKRLDGIAVTPPLYREYAAHPALCRLVPKLAEVEFPGVCPRTEPPHQKNDDGILLAYCGNLYAGLRRPESLFKLVYGSRLPHLRLAMMGGAQGRFPKGYLEGWREKLGERLIQMPPGPREGALALARRADILVNLGNGAPNQVASKLFEYISTGKPIVNLCAIEDCPSLPYMEKYPLALNITPSALASPDIAEVFDAWCVRSLGQVAPEGQISRLFHTCTPAYVAGRLEALLYGE